MNSTHDSVNGQLFYDPKAEADRANSNPPQEFTGPATTASQSPPRTSEEIHHALFSVQ